MEEQPLYRISGLRFHYGDTFELFIPGMEVGEGESIGLVGPNGGGKSTLLKLLAFLETPREGTIFFLGKNIHGTDASTARNVTILLQEPYLLKTSIFENVAYGLRVRGERTGSANVWRRPSGRWDCPFPNSPTENGTSCPEGRPSGSPWRRGSF